MAITINGTSNGKINNTSFSTTTGNAVTTGDSGTITAPMLDGGQTGSAPALAVRCYVNINGLSSPASITGSVNVSSVTDNGTGDYTVNFTTNMTAASYAAVTGGSTFSGAARNIVAGSFDLAVGSFRIRIETSDGDSIDQDDVSAAVVI